MDELYILWRGGEISQGTYGYHIWRWIGWLELGWIERVGSTKKINLQRRKKIYQQAQSDEIERTECPAPS